MSSTEEWMSRAIDRTDAFIGGFHETTNLHVVAINCLEEVFERNPNRLRIGHKNIIIIGDLALYAIPIQPLMSAFLNPWANRSDLPRVEVHPLSGWKRKHAWACIQPPGASEEPGPDTIAAICEALLADSSLFLMEPMTTFRSALFSPYGHGISPITGVFTEFLKERGADLDLESSEIVVPGSYSWKWHLRFGDPDVSDFSLHSSIKDGPRRKHIFDTGEISEFSMSPMDCIGDLVSQLRRAPRSLLDPKEDQYAAICNSNQFRTAVARDWEPLRRRFEEAQERETRELLLSEPMNLIIETVRSQDAGDGVDYNDLGNALVQGGYSQEFAEEAIGVARDQGEVTEPRFGFFQLGDSEAPGFTAELQAAFLEDLEAPDPETRLRDALDELQRNLQEE